MFTHLRESWQDPKLPVKGPAMGPFTDYTDVAIHYTSAAKIPADIDAYHRAMQADYERNRGFSLGYSCSVDQSGASREIRGLDFRPAATRNANTYAFAILVLVDGNGEASPAACAEVRRLIGEFERLAGRPLRIRGHGEYVATACPGSGLRAQIVAGVFSPRWNVKPPPPPPVIVPEPPTEEADDMPAYLHLITPTKGEWLWTPGGEPQPFKTEADALAIMSVVKPTRVAVSDAQLVALQVERPS